MRFIELIEENPIIAAVRNTHQLRPALESSCGVLFLLSADISTLPKVLKEIHSAGKQAFVHVDLMEGVARDMHGLQYLRDVCKVDGILSTQTYAIRLAKEIELATVQRLFMVDSQSIHTGRQSILQTKPDAVEIMPGIMPRITRQMTTLVSPPIIAGGLVEYKEEVVQGLKAGALGISTSNEELWNC